MKSLLKFLRYVLTDVGTWCHVSTIKDYEYILDRVKHEGIAFLAITLPTYGKDFEKSLSDGRINDAAFLSFKKRRGFPLFLGGFLRLVFDPSTGVLVDEPSIDAIKAIRQISLMFAKIKVPCSKEREELALQAYIDCEQELRIVDQRTSPDLLDDMNRIGNMLFGDLLNSVEKQIYFEGITPKHGPGSTADGLLGNKKYDQIEWPLRIEELFPFSEYVSYSYLNYLLVMGSTVFLEPGQERPVEVILVPKTLKTPRIIAREPTAVQYVQQGVLELITEATERIHTPRMLVSSVSQEPNQLLAKEGSFKQNLATLDLSEASDRVSYQHVRALLRTNPFLLECVDACRSRKADVRGHGVIRLAKFASMGSALCFPFEAMVFATAIFIGIERALSRPLTSKDVLALLGKVRVYGDDIIIPVEYVKSVSEIFELFGFKINQHKSFWTGKFRESCGKEYYDGNDVSITRVRTYMPSTRKDASEIISTSSLRNQLFVRGGFERSVAFLDILLGKIIPYPVVEATSPVIGRLSYMPYQAERMDPHLQIPLVRGMVVVETKRKNSASGPGAMTKFLLKRGLDPLQEDHLLHSGRPVSVDIKTRWCQPY